MNSCLILLTNYYPFYKGEEYLETEINYLSAKFNHIYVISTMVSNKMVQTRRLPDNVSVIPVGINHSFIGKVKMLMRNYKDIDKEKKLKLKLNEVDKFLPKLYTYYFECRAMDVYTKAGEELDKHNINQYDSIAIYSYWFYVTARVAVELKQNYFKGKNVYTISRAHGYDINEHVNPLKFLPEREFLLESLDSVYPVSQNGVDFLRNKYPKYSDKVDVRRLGTRGIVLNKQHTKSKLYIVSCSTVRKLKRIDLLIEALELLKEKNIDFKWTHIGNGPDFEKIKKITSEKLNKSHYEFTGHLKNSEVLDWYLNNPTTVFVNTSSSEGVPVSIMEAMSVGMPIIATDVGGTKEIVENLSTGFLLKKDCTKEEIAETLIRIHSMSHEEYIKMSKRSFELWDKVSNAERIYNDFANEILMMSKNELFMK